MKNLLFTLLSPLLLLTGSGKDYYMLAGTYTGEKSEGIYVYRFHADGSSEEVSHAKTKNPSFLVVSPNEKYVYAVNEMSDNGHGGRVSAYSFNKGTLTFLNDQPTGGDDPCYVDIDATGRWVFVANYSSGTLSVLPVQKDGSLGAPGTTIQHEGSGPNKDRQEKPHVHCTKISPDNKWLFVNDLGTDKIMIYAFDATSGKLTPATPPFAASEPGSGPRHIVFHPTAKYAYLVTELSGVVNVYDYSKGRLKQVQVVSTVPSGEKGFAGGADIHVSPDGKFLYASNRGDFNNIAIFRINTADGTLRNIGFQSTLGKNPRNFSFDPSGNYLLVGNQSSDEIVVFKRNKTSGLLTDTGKRIPVGKPVCIKWMGIKP